MVELIFELKKIFLFVGDAVLGVWPFFLASIAISVLIRMYKLENVIRKAFNRRTGLAIITATFVGAFSPFCSCTVVPVIASLLSSGVPLAPIMSFWVASPTMDPEIFALSVGILGWPFAIARLVATLVLSLEAGYLTLALTNTSWADSLGKPTLKREKQLACCSSTYTIGTLLNPQPVFSAVGPTVVQTTTCSTGSCNTAKIQEKDRVLSLDSNRVEPFNWLGFIQDLGQESWRLGRWLILAFILEALITLYIPQVKIASLVGGDNWFSIPIAAIVGIPLYLTNISALPIISGLLAQGMQPGAAIAFLIAGPITTFPAMTAVWGSVQRRIFWLYLSIGIFGAIAMGVIANWFLG